MGTGKSKPDVIHRTRLALTSLVALLIVGLVSTAVTWRMRLRHAVDTQLAALRSAGLPTSGAELNQWYPSVPDSENAALVLTQAFALMRTFPDHRSNEVARFKPPPRGQPLTPGQVQLLSDYVKLNAAALETAAVAVKMPRSRYPVDLTPGAYALLPHLSKIKTLAQTSSDEAMLAIDAGRAPDAAKSLKTTLGLARTLDAEPLLISQLVRIAILKIARVTLEQRLNAGPTDELELTELAFAFAGAGRSNSMARAFAGEQAMAIPYFHMSWAEMDRLAKNGEDASDSPVGPPAPGPEPFLFRLTGFFERDLRFYCGVMRTNLALASLGPPGSLAATNMDKPVEARIRSRHYILSGLLLPALSRALVRDAEGAAHIRISGVALALERFRLANQRLPDSLAELVPRFLEEFPADPFDGAPLRYRRLPKGYVVYSIGRDGRDDGGKEPPPNRRTAGNIPEDITLTVER